MEPADLFRRRDSPVPPFIVDVGLLTGDIWDDMPTTNWKIWTAVAELTNGRSAGASHIMLEEHLKEWLKGGKLEEDPEMGPNNVDTGKEWDMLVRLIQAVLDEGKIPNKLGWVVTVLIPKGGEDYRGINLFEPIWNVIEWVMNKQLEVIALHDSLHGCRSGQGAGTAVIEVKLTQQLDHIEQAPFYGVFIDLKKVFDAMDWERCLLILEGHGMGPNMRRLTHHFWDEAKKCVPSFKELWHAFQGRLRCDPRGPAIGKAF